MAKFRSWIEAMRLRTLPVSMAGVLAGIGCAAIDGKVRWIPAVVCMIFAVCAQIVSNFANEYYDFKNGLDRKGREGFRRGVTEGDLSPQSMRNATFGLLCFTCILGCVTIFYGGWLMLAVGLAIACFAIGYSAGPYPLSHHGLGDLAVVVFFGIVPVTLTAYLVSGELSWTSPSLPLSVSIGLMAANVLVVNNVRDVDDDRSVGKRTTAVIFGRNAMVGMYFVAGLIAVVLTCVGLYRSISFLIFVPASVYVFLHILIWRRLRVSSGSSLNPLLGMTAMNLLLFSVIFVAAVFALRWT